MMNLRWQFAPIFLFTLSLTTTDTIQGSPTNSILLKDLKHFKMNRHHMTNPRGKDQAQDYIWKTFTSLGLHTWSEPFNPTKEIPWPWISGFNIVGVLPGRLYKTANDRPILIGAHYDTVRHTQGVDDNGSGVVAMLQVARKLAQKSSRCTREYSVMFVAFDFEEWEKPTEPGWACAQLGCGSRAFVSNFSWYYHLRTMVPAHYNYVQLQGAIIMDTIMNYKSVPNSQIFPQELEETFPRQYESIVENKRRGDFLLVTGRKSYDRQLLETFRYYYNIKGRRQDNKYKLQVFPLPFDGQPSKLPSNDKQLFSPFLRGDHVSFWNSITSNRAIFLSDTANMRSYMKGCYHQECDNLRDMRITFDILGFLSKSCDTIVLTTEYLTQDSCSSLPNEDHEGLTIGEGAAIGVCVTLLAAANGTGAIVVYYRRKLRQSSSTTNVLVDCDQMEVQRTDDVTSESETSEDELIEA